SATGDASMSRDFQRFMKPGADICLLQGSVTRKCSPDLSCSSEAMFGKKSENACARYAGVIRSHDQQAKRVANGWKRDLDSDDEGHLRGSGRGAPVAQEAGTGDALVNG